MGGDHDAAVRVAPETELPISDRARQVLVEMRRGWRGRSLAAWLGYRLYPDVITVTPSCKAVVVLSHHIGPSTGVVAAAFPPSYRASAFAPSISSNRCSHPSSVNR